MACWALRNLGNFRPKPHGFALGDFFERTLQAPPKLGERVDFLFCTRGGQSAANFQREGSPRRGTNVATNVPS